MRYRLAAPSWPIREASAPAVGAGQAAAQSLRIEVARAPVRALWRVGMAVRFDEAGAAVGAKRDGGGESAMAAGVASRRHAGCEQLASGRGGGRGTGPGRDPGAGALSVGRSLHARPDQPAPQLRGRRRDRRGHDRGRRRRGGRIRGTRTSRPATSSRASPSAGRSTPCSAPPARARSTRAWARSTARSATSGCPG